MNKKEKKYWQLLTIIVVVGIIIGSGAYIWKKYEVAQFNESQAKSEPLTYSISGVPVSVTKVTVPFGFTADQLKSMAEGCGVKHEVGYFDKLVAEFSSSTEIVYNFKYQGATQDNGVYTVTLLPNVTGYFSREEFLKDFATCEAGGQAYPFMLSSKWLLFVNTCGTGYDDGSDLPHGCDEVKNKIESTLRLN